MICRRTVGERFVTSAASSPLVARMFDHARLIAWPRLPRGAPCSVQQCVTHPETYAIAYALGCS